jgi:uncharacterized repeat protein (TIGR01451 family)
MIFKTTLNFAVLCFAGFLACATAGAQTPAVSSVLTASLVSVVDGKTVKTPAVDAKPGDVIEYRATYANNSKAPIERLLALVPIPEGTTLIEKSISPEAASASVDAVTFAPVPLVRTIKLANGTTRTEAVPLSDYRSVRWALTNIAAGQPVTVSVNVRVNSLPSLAPLAGAPSAKP